MKEKEIGRTCGTYGVQHRCIECLGGENWGKETDWKTWNWMGG